MTTQTQRKPVQFTQQQIEWIKQRDRKIEHLILCNTSCPEGMEITTSEFPPIPEPGSEGEMEYTESELKDMLRLYAAQREKHLNGGGSTESWIKQYLKQRSEANNG